MKKFISIALCLCLALCLCACGEEKQEPKTDDIGGNTQVVNPFVDCATLEEACELAGFELEVPEMIDGFDTRAFSVEEGKSIITVYSSDDSYIKIIKNATTDAEVGDYNEYKQMKTVDAGEITPLIKGNDGLFTAASWDNGENGFYIISDIGLSEETMTELIKTVK